MSGFLGDPTRLVMKPEKPDFFLNMPGALDSLDSSENRLDTDALSIFGIMVFSPVEDRSDAVVEKLAAWGSGGGPMTTRGPELEFGSGVGAGGADCTGGAGC